MPSFLTSITVTSETKEAIIGDALRSVKDWVDEVLIIHLCFPDVVPDRTLDVAREIAGDKLRIVPMDAQGKNMADMRNFGLRTAEKGGAEWALELDTDVRMLRNGVDVRRVLKDTPDWKRTLVISDREGSLDKAIFFRLPAGQYSQGVHEKYSDAGHFLPNVRYWEIEKSPEVLHARLLRDKEGLLEQVKADPENHQWTYYLGITHEALGETDQAITCYRDYLNIPSAHNTMKGWVCYRLALIEHGRGLHSQALGTCGIGMCFCPYLAELKWLAAAESVAIRQYENAIHWATLATVKHDCERQIGFHEPIAEHEGPYQIMQSAYALIGNQERSAWAKKKAAEAKKRREALNG